MMIPAIVLIHQFGLRETFLLREKLFKSLIAAKTKSLFPSNLKLANNKPQVFAYKLYYFTTSLWPKFGGKRVKKTLHGTKKLQGLNEIHKLRGEIRKRVLNEEPISSGSQNRVSVSL